MQLLALAHRRYPGLTPHRWRGIRNLAELSALRGLGIDGALLATALPRGEITPRELRQFPGQISPCRKPFVPATPPLQPRWSQYGQ